VFSTFRKKQIREIAIGVDFREERLHRTAVSRNRAFHPVPWQKDPTDTPDNFNELFLMTFLNKKVYKRSPKEYISSRIFCRGIIEQSNNG